ncbi:DUF5667 domain-containing protein [Modestobacter sp. NPDC049651]|uniref:DUF5667 domain-containing protein n=1 Tax=unclassified Modestobacter TaxID=2643866 RepID=UPI0033DDBC08
MTVRQDDAPGAPLDREALVLTRLATLSTDLAGTDLVPAVDEGFRRAARQRLVAMAAVRDAGVRSPAARPSRLRRLVTAGRRSRLTAGLAGAAVALTALGGLLAAAQGAGPGDLLYDVKRGGERTQLALAGDSSRGSTLLEFASTRLRELDALARQSTTALPAGTAPAGRQVVLAAGADPALVVDTLRTMDGQTTEGTWWSATSAVEDRDPARLTELTRWATGQRRGLADVADALPQQTGEALTASEQLLTAVLGRADGLRAALACAGGPATDGADDLGPVPAPCPPAPTAPVRAPGSSSPSGSATAPAAPSSGSAPTSAPQTAAAGAAAGEEGGSGAGESAPASSAAPSATGRATAPSATPSSGAGSGPGRGAGAAPGKGGGLPLPTRSGSPAPAPTTAPPTTARPPLVDLPPVLPGVTLCVPPLLGVGCR